MCTEKELNKLNDEIKLLKQENKSLKINGLNENIELMNILSIGVFYCNKDGWITKFNDKFVDIIGSTKEKIRNLNIFNDIRNIEVVNGVKKAFTEGNASFKGYYKPVTGTRDIYAIGEFKGVKNEKGEVISCVCTIEDVTEDYNYKTNIANIKLNEKTSDQNYKTAFLSSPVPIIIHQDGVLKIINDAALEFGNVKKIDDAIGESAFRFVHKDSQLEAADNINNILSGGKSDVKKYKFQTFDGEPRFVISKSSLFFIDNRPAVLVSFMDITEYKKNEERLNIIIKGVEASPASIVVTDINGNIEYVNPKFCEVTGFSEKEALGKNPRVLSSGIYKQEFYKNMWGIITSGKSWRGEMLNKKKSGELFWEYVIISPIVNSKGDITNFIAIKEDITRRKEIESKLIRNEKYFKTLFETAPDGIFEINKAGIITNCNREFANSVNSIKADIIGTLASKFNENKKTYTQLFEKLKKEGSIESELIQKNSDGSTTVVWRKVTAIYDKDNNFAGALIYNRDISKIKETEQLLIDAKNKAEESDKLKSAFLSNMSHEIRTPLNAIIGFSKLVSKDGIDINEKQKFSNYININSKLLLNLINDIIDISKIEANQLNINKKEFILNSLFNELEILFNSQLKESVKNLSLTVEIPTQLFFVNTDDLRLKQILINLISNAIKFTEQGGIIFGFRVEGNKVNIFVKDTGIGIPKNKIDLVFNRFVRVHSIEYKQKGTGLGLAIVKSLVDLLDGEISIKSKINSGTEFNILLPNSIIIKNNNTSLKQLEVDNNSVDWSDKTILIAEDDEFNFIVLNELLRDFKVNIIHAKDGKEAINLYMQNKKNIDLVLMDIQMPIINGYKATQEILKINSNAKIVAQTAFAMSDEKFDSIDVGCIDFVTKPIDIQQLTVLLSNYL